MRKRRWTLMRTLGSLVLLTAAIVAVPAGAQTYPVRPVHIISDSAPGSAIDAILRIIAERLSQIWGQQVTAVNMPGAGGSIATRAAAQSAPDGYTLFVAALSTFTTPSGTAPNLPIRIPRDFLPVGHVGGAPMFIAAAPWLGVTTLPGLIKLAKTRPPNELTYATTGPGRLTHMTGELLASRAGIQLLMIPYPGGPEQALKEVKDKRVALVIETYSGLANAIQAKALIPLAVASPKRLAEFPNLATVAETLPGFESSGWQVLLAPVGTPDAIVGKINADLIKAMSHSETRKRLARYLRSEHALSPEETAAFIETERATWAPIIKQIGGAK